MTMKKKIVKQNGEDIICVSTSKAKAEARRLARRVSTSRRHGWAHVTWKTADGKLHRESYADGKLYAHSNDYFNAWFSATLPLRSALTRLARNGK